MAQCAACSEPIAKGEAFVLVRTEVFHKRCAQMRGTAGSIRVRLEQEVVRLRGEVAQQKNEADRYAVRAGSAEGEIENLRRENARLRERVDDVFRNTEALQGQRDEYKRQRDDARRERDLARAERDAARREAQLHQTIQGNVTAASPPAGPADPGTKIEDEKDATEQRFGLLELD